MIELLGIVASLVIIGFLIGITFIFSFVSDWKDMKAKIENPLVQVTHQEPPIINVDTKNIESMLGRLPNKILQSIQGSVSARKGALGELIGYMELKAEYDRIIPIGNITDFIAIKLGEEGRIDFIDVKTGKYARLSKEQKQLQQLILDKKINFKQVSISSDEVVS